MLLSRDHFIMKPFRFGAATGLLLFAFSPVAARANDEISLFDGQGEAVAYIAPDEEFTIYLWDGKPAAYLSRDGGEVAVYGFNGKHLGWLEDGLVRDHDGRVTCAFKERLQSTSFESFKSFKQFKPFKSFQELAPLRPLFVNVWSKFSCRFLLSSGAS